MRLGVNAGLDLGTGKETWHGMLESKGGMFERKRELRRRLLQYVHDMGVSEYV